MSNNAALAKVAAVKTVSNCSEIIYYFLKINNPKNKNVTLNTNPHIMESITS